MSRFNFSFEHDGHVVKIHCQESPDEARSAFQRRYGYWPGDAVWVERYRSE